LIISSAGFQTVEDGSEGAVLMFGEYLRTLRGEIENKCALIERSDIEWPTGGAGACLQKTSQPQSSLLRSEPPSRPVESLSGLIERVTFHNEENGWAVLKVKAKGHRDQEESGRGKKTKVEWIEEIPTERFYLRVGLGRKATGSFYTPHSFVRLSTLNASTGKRGWKMRRRW
jgi:hypothetical protein